MAGAVVFAGVAVVPVVVLVVVGFVVLAPFVDVLVVVGFAVPAPVVLVPVALALPAFVLPAFALESDLVPLLWARPDAGSMHNAMITVVPTTARATTGENARNISPMLWSVSTGMCEMDHGAGRSAFCGFPDREASSTVAVVPGSIRTRGMNEPS